ncbi:YihY/virulence factor BrkB family protein [Candidatus Woesearchaeota archaeon]|nr:YihY/virulence factor BrkB family protein [Candidatus Woesearchaeota archaeon]
MGKIRAFLSFLNALRKASAKDDLTSLAAGISFYFIFALVPLITVTITLLTFFRQTGLLENLLHTFSDLIPQGTLSLLSLLLVNVNPGSLTIFSIIGLVIMLWSGSNAGEAIVSALDKIYEVRKTRGFVRRHTISLELAASGVLVLIFLSFLLLVLSVALSTLSEFLPVSIGADFARFATYFLGLVFLTILVAAIYRAVPNRKLSSRSSFPGALVFSFLWLMGSLLFNKVAVRFMFFDRAYGPLGVVFITLIWIHLSTIMFLVGAEINVILRKKHSL